MSTRALFAPTETAFHPIAREAAALGAFLTIVTNMRTSPIEICRVVQAAAAK